MIVIIFLTFPFEIELKAKLEQEALLAAEQERKKQDRVVRRELRRKVKTKQVMNAPHLEQ